MKPERRLSRASAGFWPAASISGFICLSSAVWSLTIIAAKAFTSAFLERFRAIWAALISYMPLWVRLETKASVLVAPRVLALVAPTAAPVASSALLTAAPALSAVLEAALDAAFWALSAVDPAFLLQAAR